jgi:hypothetical protein
MLTVFVIPSGKPNANFLKTVESFEKMDIELRVVQITCWREINCYEDKDDWYCVFWDNEGLDVNLQKALPVHLANRHPEVLVLYKRLADDKAEYRTRFMKRSIWLTSNFKPIAPWPVIETILDGWVVEHAITDTD